MNQDYKRFFKDKIKFPPIVDIIVLSCVALSIGIVLLTIPVVFMAPKQITIRLDNEGRVVSVKNRTKFHFKFEVSNDVLESKPVTNVTTQWVGHPMVSDNDKYTPSQGWLPEYIIGFRSDGIVMWRKTNGIWTSNMLPESIVGSNILTKAE